MGAWQHVRNHLSEKNLRPLGRRASASTATGFKKVHDQQQESLVMTAFGS